MLRDFHNEVLTYEILRLYENSSTDYNCINLRGHILRRHRFDKLYGSGHTQEINRKYTLLMTDSNNGFLIDKTQDASISIANVAFVEGIIYGEYKPKIGDKKYFLLNIADNKITQLKTRDELCNLLKSRNKTTPFWKKSAETKLIKTTFPRFFMP